MDGTLVDTEPYWIETEYAIAERYGKTWSQEQALHMVGWDLLDSGAFIKDQLDLDLTPARIVDLLLDGVVERVRRTVPWRPGARELLADLRAAGVPCALVTMSYQRFVEPILEQLPADTFAAIVTGDTVENGKPHPEPYLTAARLLGVEATDCVAIEDSGTGAASAEAAGTLVLCVPNHVDVPPGERRVFADTLTGLSAADIARLAPGVRIPGSDGPTG